MAFMTGAFVLSGPLSYPYYLDGQGGYACEQAWGRNAHTEGTAHTEWTDHTGCGCQVCLFSGCWYAPRSCCLSIR